jgi:hypothetical protein
LRDIVKDYGSVFIYAGVAFFIALMCMLIVKHGDLPVQKQTAGEILDQMDN